MRRTTETALAIAVAGATLLLAAPKAQATLPTINVATPTNTCCTSAIPFCSSIALNMQSMPGGDVCLWFQFELTDSAQVSMSMSGCKPRFFSALAIANEGCSCDGPELSSFDQMLAPGVYYIVFACSGPAGNTVSITVNRGLHCTGGECDGCLPEPMLEAGREYIVNAWVKKEGAATGTVDYGADNGNRPWIKVQSPIGNTFPPCYPAIEQPVVEGWQPIECRFIAAGTSMRIDLGVENGTALFDDVRVFPADGSMKCYVYDPHNLRFAAELDERHYATFYEYDLEGKLVRVKKETERGIMTIQESRSNPSHRLP